MPIYVYGCQDCGAEEEHIQRFSDPPVTECASCGGRLHKQVTSAAFHLKGGGWYKDGYASTKGDAAAGSDAASSSTSADSSSTSDSSSKSSDKSTGTSSTSDSAGASKKKAAKKPAAAS